MEAQHDQNCRYAVRVSLELPIIYSVYSVTARISACVTIISHELFAPTSVLANCVRVRYDRRGDGSKDLPKVTTPGRSQLSKRADARLTSNRPERANRMRECTRKLWTSESGRFQRPGSTKVPTISRARVAILVLSDTTLLWYIIHAAVVPCTPHIIINEPR